MNTPRLETERLVLRRFEPSDLQAFFQIFSDGEVNRFLPWFPVRDLEEAQAFYQQRYAPVYAKAQGYAYAICRKEDNVPIGYVNGETEGARDFGYGLRKEFWGQGIVTEASRAVLAQMKEKLMPLYPNIRTFGDMESYSAVTTGEASVGFMFTPFVYMVQLDHPEFKVVYPKEGLGYGIDGLVIPTGAKHVDAAHQFLDYLMRPEVAAHNAEMQYYMCVNQAAQEYLSDAYRGASVMNVPAELLADAEFIEDVGATETVYQEIYTAFKNQ